MTFSHSDARQELMSLIRERAYRYQPDDPFTLASGRKSPFYFNCKAVTLTGRGASLVGQVLLEALDAFPNVRAVGGLTLGADPLAVSIAMRGSMAGRALDAFVVRKEAKGHGTGRWVEGELPPNCPVVVLDDVVTTGGSTVRAIERVAEAGLQILGGLVLVDRQEADGAANIEAALSKVGAPGGLVSAFTAQEFVHG